MSQIAANGITLEYDIHGKASDPAVLLIMGFSGQMVMWPMSFVTGLVELGFRVIRFDNRDVGLSTHLHDKGVPDIGAAMAARMSGQTYAGAAYALDDMAADAAGLLDALGIAQAHIVGASMGGMIAQLFAAHYPAKTLSLTSIMSTTGKPTLTQAKPEIMAVLVTPPASDSRADRIAAFLKTFRTIGSPGFPGTEEELTAIASSQVDRGPYDPAGIGRQMVAIVTADARNEILKSVIAPTLVLHGADDPLVPVDGGKDTAESIKGAELVIVPGMGHDFTEALMPQFITHVGGFLSRVRSQAKAA
ncbi:Aclacinomycin methylesterase RdmC [Alphaproteobacteria bacterium SO-S41]|nr:Aclacinomycin methylesterase RdmC [Alphaproteobacteria bacterium SO-S41]